MAYRNPSPVLSAMDDFIMQLLGMSEALYGREWIVGIAAYERHKPRGWAKLYTILQHSGYQPTRQGWVEFVDKHIGVPVVPLDAFWGAHRDAPRWCKRCRTYGELRSGLCGACYEYKRRNKKSRPRYCWDEDIGCRNCGIPLKSIRQNAKGHCYACAQYQRRTGKDRPRHLWGIGPAGWCECGYPAVAIIDKDIPVCVRHRE
jgi:hypothetical protein